MEILLFGLIWLLGMYLAIRYDVIASGKAIFLIEVCFFGSIFYTYCWQFQFTDSYIMYGFLIWGMTFCIHFLYSFSNHLYNRLNDIEYENLFPERRKDLNRILHYLQRENIIGVDAKWGMGKTYLIDNMIRDPHIKKEYDIVEMDVLTCNEDQLVSVLFHDLDKILNKNGILSMESDLVRLAFSRQINLRTIINMFIDTPYGYARQLEEFKQQLSMTRKKILIVYEDIDRIKDALVIKKIFSINEKLSSHHIKVIYQYDQKHLDEIGLSRSYIEKYIPYVIELTPVSFKELVGKLLFELNINHVALYVDDFKTISENITKAHLLEDWPDRVESVPAWSREFDIEYTPRKVKAFISDVLLFLEKYPIYNEEENKRQLIHFMYLKHIMPDCYAQLPFEGYFLNQIKYSVDNEMLTIQEVIKKYPSGIKIFEDKQNRINFLILEFLGYKQYIPDDTDERLKVYYSERNFRLDLRYKYIRTSGSELFTLQEKYAHRIIDEVLSKEDIDERIKSWNEIFPQSDNQQSVLEALRPASNFVAMMTAFTSYDISIEQEKRFLELFFIKRYEPNCFDREYIDMISLAHLKKPVIFDYIMEKTTDLKVKNNFLSYGKFIDFLNVFSMELSHHGYTLSSKRWSILEKDKLNKSSNIVSLKQQKADIIEYLQEVKERIDRLIHDMNQIEEWAAVFSNVKRVCDIIIQHFTTFEAQ